MNEIPINQIRINPNRQRKEFEPEAMQELRASIEARSLFHPPVLRWEGDGWTLVAGERRLKAIEELFFLGGSFTYNGKEFTETIPFTDIGELTELEAEEAELDENLRRRDLTWQEHAAAVERLHALRVAQKEQARAEAIEQTAPMETPATPAHTIADTAEELSGRRDGAFHEKVRKELIVAKHLGDAEVGKAKNVDEAFKLLKRREELAKNAKLAETVGASYSSAAHTVLNVDCLDWMSQPENHGKFDVICTDPPYGMGADEFNDGGGKYANSSHDYSDSLESWRGLIQAWAPLSYACAANEAHLYAFCDIDNFHEFKSLMEKAGWYVFRTPFIMYKINSGRVPLPDRGPRRQWECLLYAIKGSKSVTHIYPDVISAQSESSSTHGAAKPVSVFQNLLQRSVRPGDKVLDCFAGSGPILPAGHTYKCSVTAIEKSPASYGLCLKRLAELDTQLELL